MGRASVAASLVVLRLVLGLLVLVPVTILVVRAGFDGLYGQDAFGYLNYALGPLREAIARLDLPPAWPQPPGFPLVIAVISLVTGPDGRIALVVSAIAGASVPVLSALLASETIGVRLGGRARLGVPLGAGALAALPGQLWQSSAVAMPDTLSIALATAGAYAACRYARTGRAGWLLGASAAIAFAIDVRWVYGLVAIPIALVGLIGLERVRRADAGRALGQGLGAAAVTLAVLGPLIVPIARALLDGSTVPFVADFGAYPWDPSNALRNVFDTTDGRLVYGPTSGAFYLLQAVQPYWFGPLGVLAAWGAVWVARRGGAIAGLSLVGWPVVVLLFLAGSPYQNTRFFLAVMPPVVILVAVGLCRLAEAARARWPARWRPAILPLATLIAAGWLVVAGLVAARFTDAFIERQSRDLAAIRAIEARVPTTARLVSMGPTGVFIFDRFPDVVELFDLTPPRAFALLDDRRATYLVIDPVAIDGQWAGRGPALTVEAIRAARGIKPVAREGAWTLFLVGPARP